MPLLARAAIATQRRTCCIRHWPRLRARSSHWAWPWRQWIEDARVEALLMQRPPGVRRWFLQAQPAHDPHGLDVPSLLARLGRALLDGQPRRRQPLGTRAARCLPPPAMTTVWHSRRLPAPGLHPRQRPGPDARAARPAAVRVPAAYRDDHSYLWQHGATADDTTEALQVPAAPPPPADASAADTRRPMPKNNPSTRASATSTRNGTTASQRERTDWCTVREVVPRPQHFTACRPQPSPPRLAQPASSELQPAPAPAVGR